MGAIAELEISVDLMKKGYEVYRALSQASSCDILAMKDGKTFTFEVRTGFSSPTTGKISYPKYNIRASIVAVFVHHSKEIEYIPPMI